MLNSCGTKLVTAFKSRANKNLVCHLLPSSTANEYSEASLCAFQQPISLQSWDGVIGFVSTCQWCLQRKQLVKLGMNGYQYARLDVIDPVFFFFSSSSFLSKMRNPWVIPSLDLQLVCHLGRGKESLWHQSITVIWSLCEQRSRTIINMNVPPVDDKRKLELRAVDPYIRYWYLTWAPGCFPHLNAITGSSNRLCRSQGW